MRDASSLWTKSSPAAPKPSRGSVTAPHSRLAGSGCGIPTVFVATHDAGHQPPRGQLQQLWRRRLDLADPAFATGIQRITASYVDEKQGVRSPVPRRRGRGRARSRGHPCRATGAGGSGTPAFYTRHRGGHPDRGGVFRGGMPLAARSGWPPLPRGLERSSG